MEKKVNNNDVVVGIDLGTTTTQVAILDCSGVAKVLPNMDGDLVTPSIVSVAEKKPIVGKAAKQDKFFNPDKVAEHFKKLMDQVTEDGKHIAPVTSADGTDFDAVILSAEVLSYERRSVEKLMGRPCTRGVVSVPAYFKERARQATKDAARIAGLMPVHIENEPVAAATYYGLISGKKLKLAVFDFGGGTFDITILDVSGTGENEVIAVDGDPECGGSNIDEAIFQEVRKFAQENGGQLSPDKDLAEWLEVLDACKEAKEMLSTRDTAIIPLRISEKRISMELTYEQLKKYSADVIEVLRSGCQRALDKAGLNPSEISEVLLVGGSSRLRFVPELIKEIFGKNALTDTDPDMAVAKGNAIIAAAHYAAPDEQIIVEGKAYLASSIKTAQIAARDLCVAALTQKNRGDRREYNAPIIPAGAKLPYEATSYFTPIDAGTSTVNAKLIDGKAGARSEDFVPLVEAEVEIQPTDEANNDDRIQFKTKMDVEGLVSIEVRDKLLNKPVPIRLKFDTGLSDADIEQRQRQLEARHS